MEHVWFSQSKAFSPYFFSTQEMFTPVGKRRVPGKQWRSPPRDHQELTSWDGGYYSIWSLHAMIPTWNWWAEALSVPDKMVSYKQQCKIFFSVE